VYVDDEFIFAVESEAWYRSGLKEEQSVDEDQLNELLSDSRRMEAKRKALNMLSVRDYSQAELVSRIAQKTGSDSAEAAAERMSELGLINDERYALTCADQYYQKGYALRRIKFELQKRKLPEDIISLTLEQMDFSDSEQRALQLIERRFGALYDDAAKRKAVSYLERCGYDYSAISYAVRQLSSAEEL
jgi:regulatory protein